MGGFPKAGDEYGGRYRIVRELGHGGMGSVYEAVDKVLNRSVALKIVLPSLPDRESYQERFAREANVLARIRSRHIVGIHEYGEHEDTVFFVTELFPDGDLQTWLAKNGPLDRRQALLLVAQVCEALADAHAAGVIHRDVKPGNVLLWSRAEGLIPYLCDFGIAIDEGKKGLTRTGTLVGSPAYMAPERHFGHAADERGDIYSAGCLLWAVLTGDAPYSGTDFQMMNAHINEPTPSLGTGHPVDERIDELLADALQKDPKRRVATAALMRERLLAIVDEMDGRAPVTATTPPATTPPAAAPSVVTAPMTAAHPVRTANETSGEDAVSGPSTVIRAVPAAPAAVPVEPVAASDGPAGPAAAEESSQRSRRGLLVGAGALLALLLLGGAAAVALGGDDEPTAGDTTPTASSSTSAPSSASASPSTTPSNTPPPTPRAPRLSAAAGYRSVVFTLAAPKPTKGVVHAIEYRTAGGDWKKAGKRVAVPTEQGGDRGCLTARTVARSDGEQAVSKPVRECGTAQPRTVQFIRSPDPCVNSVGGPCTWYDVRVAGFAGPATPLVTIRRADGGAWCPSGCDWDAVRIGKDGRGYLRHDWKISRDEGMAIVTVDGASTRVHVYH